jgi:hypothetical protein
VTDGPTPASIRPNPASGDPDSRIAAALARLDECAGLPLGAQVEVFADLHRRLAEILSDPRAQA